MRLTSRLVLATFASSVALGACGPTDPVNRGPAVGDSQVATEATATATAGIPRDLETRMEALVSAWNGSDPAAVAAFFTEDATALVDGNRYTGRAQIERGWLSEFVPVISNLRFTATQTVDRRDDEVVVRGRHTFTVRAPQQSEQQGAGRHELTWARAGGTWQLRSTTVSSGG